MSKITDILDGFTGADLLDASKLDPVRELVLTSGVVAPARDALLAQLDRDGARMRNGVMAAADFRDLRELLDALDVRDAAPEVPEAGPVPDPDEAAASSSTWRR